jgi:hypothetical protein
MYTHEMREVIEEARATLRAADDIAEEMAILLRGRLRRCDPLTMAELKRELKQFNASTCTWKEATK